MHRRYNLSYSVIQLRRFFLIQAYGGLRGAVAFSLVAMLNRDTLSHQGMFETTTLVVILFTVFVQVNIIRIQGELKYEYLGVHDLNKWKFM